MLAAWGQGRAPELRRLIVALGGAEAPFSADLVARTLDESRRRLAALRPHAADPRCTALIESLLARIPWTSDSSKPVWNEVFALIRESGDGQYPGYAAFSAGLKVRAAFRKWLLEGLFGAVRALPTASVVDLDPTERAHVEALMKALERGSQSRAPVDRAALFEAVYAAPADDAPRLVLADALLELNDPRGEFISLQCRRDGLGRAEKKRVAELLTAHRTEWCDALAEVISSGASTVFRRGFAAEGSVRFRHALDVDAHGSSAAWATFEVLRWEAPSAPSAEQLPFVRFVGPAFRHLKVAYKPWVNHLLAAKEPWALEELEVHLTDPAQLAELVFHRAHLFPRLHTLVVANALSRLALVALKKIDAPWPTVKTLHLTFEQPGDRPYWLPVLQAAGVEAVQVAPGEVLRRPFTTAATRPAFTTRPIPTDEAIAAGALTAGGDVLALVPTGLARVDPASRVSTHEWPVGRFDSIRLLQGGREVLLATRGGALRRVNLETDDVTLDVRTPADTSHFVLSSDERFASFASSAGRPAVVDLQSGEVLSVPPRAAKALWVNTARTWWLAPAKGRNKTGYEVTPADGGRPLALEGCETMTDFTVDEEARTLTVRAPDAVSRWSLDDGRLLARFGLSPSAPGFGFLLVSADGRTVATNVSRHAVQVLDSKTLTLRTDAPVTLPNLRWGALSADGTRVLLGDGHALAVFEV